MVAYRYDSWQKLTRDECKFGINANYLCHRYFYFSTPYDPSKPLSMLKEIRGQR